MQIKSILSQITDIINQCNNKNIKETKTLLVSYINCSKIKDRDKTTLVNNINKCCTSTQLQLLFYNSLLKYEGLGVL